MKTQSTSAMERQPVLNPFHFQRVKNVARVGSRGSK